MIKKEQLKECESNFKIIKWNKIKCYGTKLTEKTNQEKDWKTIIKRMNTIFDIKTKKIK
jgi:hypothetical protein